MKKFHTHKKKNCLTAWHEYLPESERNNRAETKT